MRRLDADALANAIETPRIALAPSRLLVGVPSSSNHGRVKAALVERRGRPVRSAQFLVHVADGRQHALAQEPLLVAVAQFEGFAFAGRRPRRNRRAPEGAVGQGDVDFHRGIAAGIQDFPSVHCRDFHVANLDQEGRG